MFSRSLSQKVERCDRCAPIKLRFRKWLLAERAKRHRAHERACLCGALDVECLQDNVSRIKLIQTRIEARRQRVLALHRDCQFGPSSAPASSTSDQLLLTTAALSSTERPQVQIVSGARDDIPGPGQILVIQKN